ncbi:MAG: glucokinase [Devosia sp.]
MIEHSRHALVGTIGATYITLAIADIDELSFENFALLNTADFSDPMQAVERYLKSVPRCPNKVALAVSGDVTGDAAVLSHNGWKLGKNDVRAVTAADHVKLINDFEALALSLPSLGSYETIAIHPGEPVKHATRLVIYSGTDLGVAALIHDGSRWVPVRGEAGRMAFAVPPAELDVTAAMKGTFVSAGDVFSGRGLVAVYNALTAAAGGKLPAFTARQIAEAGQGKDDPVAQQALQLITTWLGRFAGDMALAFGARGGVYLTGGFASNIVPALKTGHFNQAFEDKGDARDVLRATPVSVIKIGADAAMRGAALALADSLPVRAVPRHAAR